MATNFPSSLDTSTQQPTIASSDEMDDSGKEHDVVHTNHSGAIIALETKLGTGDTTASSGALLVGTGSGTSAWDTTPSLAGDVTNTGDFTAMTGGADGGIVLGQAYSSSYVGLRTAGMAEDSADEYILISDGGNTFISGGGGTGNTEGDVYIRAGGNSSDCQIFLDTSDNDVRVTGSLGVGTAAVAGNFTVKSQNREVSILDSGTNNRAELRAHATGAAGSYAYMQYNAYSHRFLTEGTVQAEISNSGILTTSNVPAFRVSNTTGGGGYLYRGSVDGAGYIIFGTDAYDSSDSGTVGLFDNGNNYNTSTGIFTAPVTGYYLFTVTVFKHTNYDNDTSAYWGFNTSNGQIRSNHGINGQDGGQTISAVMHLDANDTCGVYMFSALDIYTWKTENYNSFSGVLLG